MRKGIIASLLRASFIIRLAAFLYSVPSYCLILGRRSNIIVLKDAFLKKTRIRLYGKNNYIKISSENRLNNCLLHISGNNCKIEIGPHCILSFLELWIEDDGSSIKIGTYTTIEGAHIAATEGQSISIGDDCMFSHGIEIRNGDSHAIIDRESKQRINNARSVIIGNHCWLGADTKILKGSQVEDGCVIAAGAIVTGSTEMNSIYAGIPSKKVKKNILWLRRR